MNNKFEFVISYYAFKGSILTLELCNGKFFKGKKDVGLYIDTLHKPRNGDDEKHIEQLNIRAVNNSKIINRINTFIENLIST